MHGIMGGRVSLNLRIIILVSFVATGLVSAPAIAQVPSRTTSQMGIHYEGKLKDLGEFAALDNTLFGDQMNLYTGAVQFVQTDVNLVGNDGLPMRFMRSLSPENKQSLYNQLGDWEVEIPHVAGTYGKSGWVSMAGPRCSVPLDDPQKASPPSELVWADGAQPGGIGFSFDPHFYWSGNSLHLPGEGDRRMLVADANAKKPANGLSHHWMTSERWTFSCLPSTANGAPGEGFLAHAPNGDRYWFDWIVGVPEGTMEAWYGNGTIYHVSRMPLTKFKALPTRIEDRNGNSVTFTYSSSSSAFLSSMNASDGRSIVFRTVTPEVSEVVADGRVWRYTLSGQSAYKKLSALTLPDGSGWTFNAGTASSNPISGWRDCADFVPGLGQGSTVVMTHPSGATGSFELIHRLHGRTGAQYSCRPFGSSFIPVESHVLTALSLDRKVISGPGLATRSWVYRYSPLAASLTTGQHIFCSTLPCPEVRDVTVTRENGVWSKYTFSQKYGDLEGKLLAEEQGGANGVLRRTDYQYRKTTDGSYARIGSDPCWVCAKEDEMPKPMAVRTVQQDGQIFTYRVEQYDAFARPIRITRASSP